MKKSIVVIGFLGTQLDAGQGAGRWNKWRPTVSLAQHEDMVVSRMELLYTLRHKALAEVVKADIVSVSPETTVNLVPLELADPWDFGEVYTRLYDWARAYPFDTEREQYWTHITTGTHVAQICMFLLSESRVVPGVLAQTSPPKKQREGEAGKYALIDLDLSRYDVIAQRFDAEQRDAIAFLKSGIATRNARFNALIDEIERVAVRSRAPILLVGPTGAGKSFLARRMFELKQARHQMTGPFVEVNCATLRGDGAASTLFGHKKGSFTGAASDRAGPAAHGAPGRAVPRRDRRARARRTGHAAEGHRGETLLSGGRRQGSGERLPADCRHQPRPAQRRGRRALSRRPVRAHQPLDLRPARPRAAARRHRAQRRPPAGHPRGREPPRGALQRRGARGLPALRAEPAGAVERQLPRPVGQRDAACDAGRRRAHSGGAGGGGDCAAALAVEAFGPVAAHGGDIDLDALLGEERARALDLFDRLQLEAVLRVCRHARSLSDAGRQLFQVSREQRSVVNDADRLRKYLAKLGIDWAQIAALARH
jgi:transcriptional regulatory protein RtcR